MLDSLRWILVAGESAKRRRMFDSWMVSVWVSRRLSLRKKKGLTVAQATGPHWCVAEALRLFVPEPIVGEDAKILEIDELASVEILTQQDLVATPLITQ